jgi:hypothetical protein
MRNKVAKSLRKKALDLSDKRISVKLLRYGQYIWENGSPKRIYKELKKQYSRKK